MSIVGSVCVCVCVLTTICPSHLSREGIAYEANYCAGLRVLDVTNIKESDGVKEVIL